MFAPQSPHYRFKFKAYDTILGENVDRPLLPLGRNSRSLRHQFRSRAGGIRVTPIRVIIISARVIYVLIKKGEKTSTRVSIKTWTRPVNWSIWSFFLSRIDRRNNETCLEIYSRLVRSMMAGEAEGLIDSEDWRRYHVYADAIYASAFAACDERDDVAELSGWARPSERKWRLEWRRVFQEWGKFCRIGCITQEYENELGKRSV